MKIIFLMLTLMFLSNNSNAQNLNPVNSGDKITKDSYNLLVDQINKIRNLEVYSEVQESIADYDTAIFSKLANNAVTLDTFETNTGSGLYSFNHTSGVATVLKDNVDLTLSASLRLAGAANFYIVVNKVGSSAKTYSYTTEGIAGYGDTAFFKGILNTGDTITVFTDGTNMNSNLYNQYTIFAKRKAKISELID